MRALFALVVLLSCATATPNIVWIMADDLGWGEPGLYPCTSPHGRISTPHLDALGRQGMRFVNAYAGYTVCAPSRLSLFSGRNSGHFSSIAPPTSWKLLPEMLKDGGYHTACVGKSAPLDNPPSRGFDFFWGQTDQSACHNMYPTVVQHMKNVSAVEDVHLHLNDKSKSRELCMASPDAYNYTTDAFHAQAMAYLDSRKGTSQPFFLYLSFTVPHAGGWSEAPADKESGQPVPTDLQYANKKWPEVERDHAATITYVDAKIGEVVAKLASLGLSDSTVIFFASDNGAHNEGGHDHTFFNSTGGLRGFKRSYHEGGIRSPSMVVWPGVVKENSVSDALWAFWDVMPTIADIAGLKAPSPSDGRSIVPALRGEKLADPEYMYWTWKNSSNAMHTDPAAPKGQGFAVRVGKWKGVVRVCKKDLKPSLDDKMELFDLSVDPFETNDISKKHSDQVTAMLQTVVKQGLTCECWQC